jgi:transposase
MKLAEARLPVVVVNPRRVRSFGEAVGCLAKTDPIDARLLSQFGEKVERPLRPITEGRERLLADLVARRRQLVAMVVAEKNRRECAPAGVRRSIASVLKVLEGQIRSIDLQLEKMIEEDEERAELSKLLQSVPGVGPGVSIPPTLTRRLWRTSNPMLTRRASQPRYARNARNRKDSGRLN